MKNKQCFFDFGQLHIVHKDKCEIFVRNGDRELNLGDVIGGRRIVKIEGYGREIETLPAGMTAKITLNGVPLLTIAEPYKIEF